MIVDEPSRRTLGLTAAGGAAVFAVAAAGAAGGRVSHPEATVFHWVNGWPDSLEPALWVFQLGGVLVVPLVAAAVAWACGRRRLAVVLAALVPAKLVVEHAIVKQLVHRQRPGLTICHLDRACASFRHVPMTGPSFVSGHAIIAWSVAAVLWWNLPKPWRWLPIAAAAMNSIARVYLGAHSPLDLVGGAGIGVALGALVLLIAGSVPVHRQLSTDATRPPEPRGTVHGGRVGWGTS